MILQQGTFLVLLAVLTTSVGCSNKMSFSQDAKSTSGGQTATGTTDGGAGAGDTATQAVAATCENAQASGRMLEVAKPVTFANPARTCDWGKDGNLMPLDQFHQGRIQQIVAVDLPAGSTLCHVKFEFPKQQFRFDDHFWLTFNDVILAASIDYRDRFGVTNGLSLFDWKKIAGTRWDTSREGVWCLGGAACSWPSTDTEGTISMDFKTGTYYAVSARDRARTRHEFAFTTVGDNDATDCQHRPVTFSATLQYVK